MIIYAKNMLNTLPINIMEVRRRKSKRDNGDPIYYDNIFSFDIETTSAYITPDGNIIPYDYSKDEKFYSDCQKIGYMYIWMFGIDNIVIYGREWSDFMDFLSELNKIMPHHKIIYVHNLGFEFQFLRNYLKFDRVFARNKRKPLTADIDRYNIHFRCSYYLVNMSLDKWATQKNLSVKKAVGSLDYNKIRTPLTALTQEEMDYCERDILVMYEGLKQYREKYDHIFKIPLTQTGEIRLQLQRVMQSEYKYRLKQASFMPQTLQEYNFLMSAFFGGDTHANYIYADKLLHNVRSYDFASSYPFVMLSEMYPNSRFTKVNIDRERFMRNPYYSYIVTFEAVKISSRLFNTFLSRSRCQQAVGVTADNGRILKADYVLATFTNLDFEMFLDFYECKAIEILDFRVAPNAFLNVKFCQQILSMYRDKTTLRGIAEKEDLYLFSKQCINGIYGDMVTRDFTDEIIYDNDTGWDMQKTTEETYQKRYEIKQRQIYKSYKSINTGIFITAYARRNLWRGVIAPLDDQIVYFDTDSGKFIGPDKNGVISSYNMSVYLKHYKIAERLGVDPSDLSPIQPDGKPCPIGCLDYECKTPAGYEDFKTLGAKKYALKEGKNVKITIAGVPKKGGQLLEKVDDLNNGYTFTPAMLHDKQCEKFIAHYLDEQPQVDIDGWILHDVHGLCLQPTGYHVGMTWEYLQLLIANREKYMHDLDFMEG